MLQQGRTVADVLYLTPEGAPHVFLPPQSALEALPGDVERYRNFRNTPMMPDKRGYGFDGCPPGVFMRAEVRDGMVVLPGGATYRLLVLPVTETMTPALLKKIKQLIEDGATVTGSLPSQSPSLENYPACDEEVRQLVKEINGLKNFIGYEGETDNLYPPYDVTSAILGTTTPPDFVSTGEVRYHHRTTPTDEIYFVSNRSDTIQSVVATFRVSGVAPQLWNPVTGERRPLPQYTGNGATTSIPMQFAPYESFFVVFHKSDTVTDRPAVDGVNFPEQRDVLTLDRPWTVSFDPKWGGPASVVFDTLSDWSLNADEGIKYYSGAAFYTATFTLPALEPQARYRIDLGTVRNIARITLNGKDLGVVWTAPWGVDITSSLRSGDNTLTVEVVNLWANRLTGDEHLPDDGIGRDGAWPDWLRNGAPRTSGRYTFTTSREYRKNSPLLESGLLGPVKVVMSN
jgi:hypothetical protein